MRLQRLALLHPGLERIERAQRRIDAERERGTLRARGGVGENPKAARQSLDLVEQQRRTIRPSGGDLGDAADLEPRISTVDPTQTLELVDALDEFAQIPV